MKQKYEQFISRINIILNTIKNEYDSIINNYNVDKICERSIPNEEFKNIPNSQISELRENLSVFLKDLTTDIDSSIFTFEPCQKNIKHEDERIISKACYSFYVFRYIRYNIIMNFIMQIYLVFEKELIHVLHTLSYIDSKPNTLFEALDILKKKGVVKNDSNTKIIIDKYRNIINIYKHGNGTSFNWMLENYPEIFNVFSFGTTLDSAFVFNLSKISVEEIYNTLIGYLKTWKF